MAAMQIKSLYREFARWKHSGRSETTEEKCRGCCSNNRWSCR
jgi:hypothetical protein